jgi:hypothetical protein
MIVETPLQLIFRDLFYRLPAFAGSHDVFLKLEGFNITGSIKVKTALGLVEDLEQRRIARQNETVFVESSSGNLGLALSLICAIKSRRGTSNWKPLTTTTIVQDASAANPIATEDPISRLRHFGNDRCHATTLRAETLRFVARRILII